MFDAGVRGSGGVCGSGGVAKIKAMAAPYTNMKFMPTGGIKLKNMHEYPVEGLEESTAIEKEYVLKDMYDLIDGLDIPEHKKKNGLKSFKNIINRAYITGREAHTLKGILRRLKMKMGKQ